METQVETIEIAEELKSIFAAFEAHGTPGNADGDTTTYLFKLVGEAGGNHLLTLSPEGASWQSDYEGDANVTITVAPEDLIAMSKGDIDARFAVSSEKIEIDGDIDAAVKMFSLVDPPFEIT